MSTIAMMFSKAWLLLSLALGSVSTLPVVAPTVASPSTTGSPASFTADRLERVWLRQQSIYVRLGLFFDRVDDRISRGQALIVKAKANGKDVTALQQALDAFAAAVKQARPAFESGKGIVPSHQGFDAAGKVVDATKARETVSEMRALLLQIRDTVKPAVMALRDAVRAFR